MPVTFPVRANGQVPQDTWWNDVQAAIEDIDANGPEGILSAVLGSGTPDGTRVLYGDRQWRVPPAAAASNLPWIRPEDFGAVGDGVANDTTPFANTLAAVAASAHRTLLLGAGKKYLIPDGITESISGLSVICFGYNRAIGPGADHSGIGATIVTTNSGKWCWTHVTSNVTVNQNYGPQFMNVVFRGNSVTAGGFRNLMFCNVYLQNCLADNHLNGYGFFNGFPSGATGGADQSWATLRGCGAINCKWAFVDGMGDFATLNGSAGSDTVYDACFNINNTAGGIARTAGTIGFWLNASSRTINCKAEGCDIGYLVSTLSQAQLMSPRAEECNTCIKLFRGTNGTATSGTTTSLTMTGASWEPSRWKGMRVTFISGAGAGQIPAVADNTATTITFTAPVATAPNNTTVFRVAPVNPNSRIKVFLPMFDSNSTVGINVGLNQAGDALIGYDTLIGTTLLIDNGVSTKLML